MVVAPREIRRRVTERVPLSLENVHVMEVAEQTSADKNRVRRDEQRRILPVRVQVLQRVLYLLFREGDGRQVQKAVVLHRLGHRAAHSQLDADGWASAELLEIHLQCATQLTVWRQQQSRDLPANVPVSFANPDARVLVLRIIDAEAKALQGFAVLRIRQDDARQIGENAEREVAIPEDRRDVVGSETRAVADAARERHIRLERQSRNYTLVQTAIHTLLATVGQFAEIGVHYGKVVAPVN